MGLSVEFYKRGLVLGWFLPQKGYTNHAPWEMWLSRELFVDNCG